MSAHDPKIEITATELSVLAREVAASLAAVRALSLRLSVTARDAVGPYLMLCAVAPPEDDGYADALAFVCMQIRGDRRRYRSRAPVLHMVQGGAA